MNEEKVRTKQGTLPPFRPITDIWILARPKLKDGRKYYGAYPAGFLERARALLAVTIYDPVLHVCGGMAKYYPYERGFGPNDKTLDLDPETEPDYCQDARSPYPPLWDYSFEVGYSARKSWPAIIADPPYDRHHAGKYKIGADVMPTPGEILKNSLEALRPGGRVGILGWQSPRPKDKTVKLVAVISVWLGWEMKIRVFTVYEKVA